MKATFVLAALATLAMAAPADNENGGVASEGAMKTLDANQEISLVSRKLPEFSRHFDSYAY